jgi:hypothetical protein
VFPNWWKILPRNKIRISCTEIESLFLLYSAYSSAYRSCESKMGCLETECSATYFTYAVGLVSYNWRFVKQGKITWLPIKNYCKTHLYCYVSVTAFFSLLDCKTQMSSIRNRSRSREYWKNCKYTSNFQNLTEVLVSRKQNYSYGLCFQVFDLPGSKHSSLDLWFKFTPVSVIRLTPTGLSNCSIASFYSNRSKLFLLEYWSVVIPQQTSSLSLFRVCRYFAQKSSLSS